MRHGITPIGTLTAVLIRPVLRLPVEDWRLVFGPNGSGWISPGVDDPAVARERAGGYHPGVAPAVRRCVTHPDGRLEVFPPEAP